MNNSGYNEPSEPPSGAIPAKVPAPNPKPRIVVVEDSSLVRAVYHRVFEKNGFQVWSAQDGQSGLDLILEHKPSIVLTDLQLPCLNGIEILKAVRQNPETRDTPVIVFSATFLGETLRSANEWGATRCLLKQDHSPESIVEEVRKVLHGRPTKPTRQEQDKVAFDGKELQLQVQQDAEGLRQHIRERALAQASQSLAKLGTLAAGLGNQTGQASPSTTLRQMSQTCQEIAVTSARAGLGRVAQLATTVEFLLAHLVEQPADLTSSVRSTLETSLRSMEMLLNQTNASQAQSPVTAHVLAVDDDVICLKLLEFIVKKVGCRLSRASSGIEAKALVDSTQYDLALLDIDMPGMTGVEFASYMRQTPLNKSTPVVFVTSVTDQKVRDLAKETGCQGWLNKPFRPSELSVTIVAVLAAHQLQDNAPPLSTPKMPQVG